ncbi:MAG: lipopolysaccharide biosynthesis protein [Deltaproteobacteria bacterium]
MGSSGVFEEKRLSEQVTSALFWNTVTIPVIYLISFVSSIFVARFLGPDKFSIFGIVNSILNSLMIYIDFGLVTGIIKFLPEAREGQNGLEEGILTLIVAAKAGLSILAAALINVFSDFFAGIFNLGSDSKLFLAFVSILLLLSIIEDISNTILISEFKHKTSRLIYISSSILLPLLNILVVVLGCGVRALLLVMIIVGAYKAVLSVYYSNLWTKINFQQLKDFTANNFTLLKRYFEFCLSGYVIRFARYLWDISFMVLLAVLLGYNSAIPFLMIGYILVQKITTLLYAPFDKMIPSIISRAALDKTTEELNKYYDAVNKYIIIVYLPIGFLLYTIFPQIIVMFYGAEYQSSVIYAQIFLIIFFLSTLASLGNTILFQYEKYKLIYISLFISLLILLLVPISKYVFFSIVPIVIIIGISKNLFHIFTCIQMHRIFKDVKYPTGFLLKVLSCSLPQMMLFVLFNNFFTQNILGLLLYGLGYFMVFILMLVLTNPFSDKEKEYIKLKLIALSRKKKSVKIVAITEVNE